VSHRRHTPSVVATDDTTASLALVVRSHVLADRAGSPALRRSFDHLIRLAGRAPLRFTSPDEAFLILEAGACQVPGRA
jgi:hypothetical protein